MDLSRVHLTTRLDDGGAGAKNEHHNGGLPCSVVSFWLSYCISAVIHGDREPVSTVSHRHYLPYQVDDRTIILGGLGAKIV